MSHTDPAASVFFAMNCSLTNFPFSLTPEIGRSRSQAYTNPSFETSA